MAAQYLLRFVVSEPRRMRKPSQPDCRIQSKSVDILGHPSRILTVEKPAAEQASGPWTATTSSLK